MFLSSEFVLLLGFVHVKNDSAGWDVFFRGRNALPGNRDNLTEGFK